MSADPTDVELGTFDQCHTILTWAGIPGPYAGVGAATSAGGSLLAILGAADTTAPRAVGAISAADYTVLLGTWQPGQPPAAPTPVQMASAVLFGRACRIKAGFQLTLAATAAAAAAKAPPPPPPPLGVQRHDMVILSEITNQVDQRLAPKLTAQQLDDCHRHYRAVFEEYPPEESEATNDQLAALAFLLDLIECYVDFALWGPRHSRILKKLRLRGMVFDAHGELTPSEVSGPPTHHLWVRCWDIFRTAMISHRATSLGALEAYKKHISDYNNRYGKECWHLIYQADVRFRAEHLERIRRRLADLHTIALAAGNVTAYDAARPFALAWQEALKDVAWWKKEVEDPCMLFLTKTSQLNNLLGGDAPVESAAASSTGKNTGLLQQEEGREPGAGVRGGRNRSGTGGSGNDAPKKKPQRRQQHNVTDGYYTTNRGGNKLCDNFQNANCQQPLDGNGRCQIGWHQCSRCLSKDHGSCNCGKDAPPALHLKLGRGRGRGRGGRRGGKGR
jgi:hypothetical protein